MSEKLDCSVANAERFANWITTRGGIAVWRSENLSNPGASWSTPAKQPDGTPTPKPSWERADKPERIITDGNDVVVFIPKEVKRFHVATRMGGNGLQIKVTDGGTRRIRSEVAKAGEGAYYEFDYGDYKNCVIMATDKEMTLTEFIAKKVAA